ncbi:MAG: hypothetical protein B7Z31_08800 [Rhodobacterales bacterium 12-65-15]|nr:MAG: hypothetical protein B7Z31_08800 [Rhodobacterales bacterium 12-65-15]
MSDSFVRIEMVPAKAPPLSERGLLKWLRENLFAGPFNTILTLATLYALFLLLRNVIPWLANGVWYADNLQECRDIITAYAGEGATGACWAMIRERWNQFIFGLYPQDLYWRPAVAFVLLFAAIAPVLFPKVPRQMLWLTLFYPAIAFFLIWGGSIWTPIVAMLGFGVMMLAYRVLVGFTGVTVAGVLGVLAAVLWWLFADAAVAEGLARALPIGLESVGSDELGGFLLALAAYLAEVIRGGLAALPRGQYEAADALGLDYWRAQRLIILPQALKISIPAIVSTFIGLFKDTTLVSFVALLDPLRGVTSVVRADLAWKGIYWEPYIFVGAIFFIICFGMSRYSMYLEQKLKTDHR